jgi:hypothetical protein
MELFTLGIDLGKTTFHLVGMSQRGDVVLRKRFSRAQLLHFTANPKVELIGMEACLRIHPEPISSALRLRQRARLVQKHALAPFEM